MYELSQQFESLEIIDASELPKDTPTISFDSIDEFKNVIENTQSITVETIEDANDEVGITSKLEGLPLSNSSFTTLATTKNGASTIKWFTAEDPSYVYKVWLPASMWIDFEYTYTGSGSTKKFSKIKKVVSESSGVVSNWHQTTYAANFYDSNKGVSIKIQGYHLLGVNIAGQSIGAKFSDSYTKKYHF